MMLYPPMSDLIDKVGSRYLLVNLVARRARDIADECEESGEIMDEKTVSCAINEVYTGKLIVTGQADAFSISSEADKTDAAETVLAAE